MSKVNPKNGNETKSDIFQWEIFKSDTISFFIKKYRSITVTFKIEISQFLDWSEPNLWKLYKIRHFLIGHIFKSDIIFY